MMIFWRVLSKALSLFMIGASKLLPYRGEVYMFHSVGDDSHDLNVSTVAFETLLKKLQNKNVIRLEDWGKSNNYIILTFDDVADSFYYNAFPLLKKYRLPFTIFVSCSLLDTEKHISTAILKELAECRLCTVGSHGWKHSFYVNFDKEEANKDLLLSKRELEDLTQKKVFAYAFPFGSIYACGFGKKKYVRSYYKYGFGTIASPITQPNLFPNYYLPRIKVDESFIYNL